VVRIILGILFLLVAILSIFMLNENGGSSLIAFYANLILANIWIASNSYE